MVTIKRYYKEFGLSMLAYTIALPVSISFIVMYPESVWRIPMALLPVVPMIFCIIAVIRHLATMDELQQKVQLLSFATSFAVVGLATFTYGFLENVGAPHIPYVWVFPAMIAVWGITNPLVMKRYQ